MRLVNCCRLDSSSTPDLPRHLECLTHLKSYDIVHCNRGRFTNLGIATLSLRLVTQLKIAQAGKLDRLASPQAIAKFVGSSADRTPRLRQPRSLAVFCIQFTLGPVFSLYGKTRLPP